MNHIDPRRLPSGLPHHRTNRAIQCSPELLYSVFGQGIAVRLFVRTLIVILLLAVPTAALAEKRVALVFSAEDYRTLRPLANPGNDARAVGDALEALDFEVISESDRDLKRMRRALEDFREDAAGADVALIYFAGHGVEIDGYNYLAPIDADASSVEALKASALPLEELRSAAASVAKTVLIVLDACRNDPFGGQAGTMDNGRDTGFASSSSGRAAPPNIKPGLGRVGRAENTLFAFSAAPGETASDGEGGNSPFSAALARYLGTNGLEIRSVLTLVQQEVYDQSGGMQQPYVENGLPRLFFAAETGPLPERETLLLAMADVTPDMRAEVERVATSNSMPLAPLFGALISADLKSMTIEDRDKRLSEAAQAFVKTRNELRNLSSTDPEVTRLRGEAEQALALGAFARAGQALDAAARIDASSGETLARNLVARRLSEADSHQARAGVAMAQLDYDGAIAAYLQAATLHERMEKEDVPDQARRTRTWLLSDLGDLYLRTGSTENAHSVALLMQQAANARLKAGYSTDAERDVSVAYNKLGDLRVKNGDFAGAQKLFRDGFEIVKRLSEREPDNLGLLDDMIVSLGKTGDVLMFQGDVDGAVRALESEMAIMDKLVAAVPEDVRLQRNMSIGFRRLGTLLVAKGNLATAQEAFEGGLETARYIEAQQPDNVLVQRDITTHLERIGSVQVQLGDLTAALKSFQDALSIAEKLVRNDPNNTELQSELANRFIHIGDVRFTQGNRTEAASAYEKGSLLKQQLAQRDPANAEWQIDFAVSREKLGDIAFIGGDYPKALEIFEDILATRQRYLAQSPHNTSWQRDLSVVFNKLGNVHAARQDFAAALMAYQDGLQIIEGLVAKSTNISVWQRDRMVSLISVGDMHLAQGELPQAEKAYQDGVAIAEVLAAYDQNNAGWQRDLSIGFNKIGDVRLARDDHPGALESYQKASTIIEKLAAQYPDRSELQRDLILSAYKLSTAGDRPRENLERALKLVETMQENGTLAPADDWMPDFLHNEIANLK